MNHATQTNPPFAKFAAASALPAPTQRRCRDQRWSWLSCPLFVLGCSVSSALDGGAFAANAGASSGPVAGARAGETGGEADSGSGLGGNAGTASAGGGGSGATGSTTTADAGEPAEEPPPDLTRGLILHYAFDEQSGAVIHDASGAGKDAVLKGQGSWLATGKRGGALGLAGGNGDSADPQYVEMPVGVIDSLREVTVSSWVRWEGGPSWQRVFDIGFDLEHCFFYSPDGNGAGRAMVRTIAGKTDADLFMTERPPLSSWTHLAVSWGPEFLRVYLDGILVEEAPSPPFIAAPGVPPSSLGLTPRNYIGRSQGAVDPYFAGAIDDFRIYDRALSSHEIRALRDG